MVTEYPIFLAKGQGRCGGIDVEDGEVILLCSDGLCGVCRDEEIGGIIEEETDNLQTCKEKLTAAALQARGSDNITIALLQVKIHSGNPPPLRKARTRPHLPPVMP